MKPILFSNKFYIDGNCYIHRTETEKDTEEHTHDFLEIVYVSHGKCVHYIDGEAYPMSGGDMLFINLGRSHSFKVINRVKYTDIIIKPELINESLRGTDNAFALLSAESFKEFEKSVNRDNCLLHFSHQELRTAETLISWVMSEQQRHAAGKELFIHSAFNMLLTVIFRKMSLPMRETSGDISRLPTYIKENCRSSLTLEHIAESFHYSPAYLSRAFKEKTGKTFTSYLTDCRIELAEELLLTTDMKIEDIISETGFTDRTKFFRCFSARNGTTPLKYRKSKK